MNIEEKRQAIKSYCLKHYDKRYGCDSNCKLYKDENVVNCYKGISDEEIEYNYNAIFATDINIGSKYEAALNYLFKKSVEEDAEKDILITLQTALNYAHKKGKV